MAVALHAAADDAAVEHIEGGEQGGRAMALVVMGHGGALARFERQPGLTAVEGLDLALLIDRQHDRVGRRVHVQPDDVAQLVGERRIAGALEGSNAVGLQAVRPPDPLHRAEPDTDRPPAAPMGCLARRLGAGQRHHPFHRLARQRRLAGNARLLAQQAVHPGFRKAPLPAPHRRTPARRATSRTGNRSAEKRIIRARSTCLCRRLRSPAIAARRARSSAFTTMQTSWAMPQESHGTSPL